MCDCVAAAPQNRAGVSRRRFIRTGGAVAAGLGLTSVTPGVASAAVPARPSQADLHLTRLVLLGTAGGPIVEDRVGISTAIVYQDRVYVVDLGHGAHRQLLAAGLGPEGSAGPFGNIAGIFFTHMHSDHFAAWPAVYATGASNILGVQRSRPIQVFGPGNRGTLPRVFPGRPEPEVEHPEDPTPGISEMTGHLDAAFAADMNDRQRNRGRAYDAVFDVHDIDISSHWTVDEQGVPPDLPPGTRIPVWADGEVSVTATLVDHRPTAPAFAYRFDTPDGSIVVSGDTAPHPNLIDLARGADYLVHEVIDAEWVEEFTADLPPEQAETVREHLLASHTTIEQVGRDVAEPAGVSNLVLTHLSPADNPVSRWQQARRGFSGRLIVGHDLMELGVGAPRSLPR